MQNFLSSRKNLSTRPPMNEAIRAEGGQSGIKSIEVSTSSGKNAKVELVSESGIIKTIVVTCACGERLELKCEY